MKLAKETATTPEVGVSAATTSIEQAIPSGYNALENHIKSVIEPIREAVSTDNLRDDFEDLVVAIADIGKDEISNKKRLLQSFILFINLSFRIEEFDYLFKEN